MQCPRCGAQVDESDASCTACGHELAVGSADDSAEDQSSSPQRTSLARRFLRLVGPVRGGRGRADEAEGGYRTVTCPLCGADNVVPAQPVPCTGNRCPAVVLPSGSVGLPASAMRAAVLGVAGWLMLFGGLAYVLRGAAPGMYFQAMALIGGGFVCSALKSRRALLFGAAVLGGVGVWNLALGLRPPWIWAVLGVVQVVLAYMALRRYQRYEYVVAI